MFNAGGTVRRTGMIRVLIVENEGHFQEMFRGSLSGQPQLEVVGVVGDGEWATVSRRWWRRGSAGRGWW